MACHTASAENLSPNARSGMATGRGAGSILATSFLSDSSQDSLCSGNRSPKSRNASPFSQRRQEHFGKEDLKELHCPRIISRTPADEIVPVVPVLGNDAEIFFIGTPPGSSRKRGFGHAHSSTGSTGHTHGSTASTGAPPPQPHGAALSVPGGRSTGQLPREASEDASRDAALSTVASSHSNFHAATDERNGQTKAGRQASAMDLGSEWVASPRDFLRPRQAPSSSSRTQDVIACSNSRVSGDSNSLQSSSLSRFSVNHSAAATSSRARSPPVASSAKVEADGASSSTVSTPAALMRKTSGPCGRSGASLADLRAAVAAIGLSARGPVNAHRALANSTRRQRAKSEEQLPLGHSRQRSPERASDRSTSKFSARMRSHHSPSPSPEHPAAPTRCTAQPSGMRCPTSLQRLRPHSPLTSDNQKPGTNVVGGSRVGSTPGNLPGSACTPAVPPLQMASLTPSASATALRPGISRTTAAEFTPKRRSAGVESPATEPSTRQRHRSRGETAESLRSSSSVSSLQADAAAARERRTRIGTTRGCRSGPGLSTPPAGEPPVRSLGARRGGASSVPHPGFKPPTTPQRRPSALTPTAGAGSTGSSGTRSPYTPVGGQSIARVATKAPRVDSTMRNSLTKNCPSLTRRLGL